MIRGFWKSRLVFSGICVLTLVLAVALWVRDRNYEIYIPIVASVLMLGIGYSAAVLAGNLVANQENTKYLGILHVDLDPARFVKVYGPVVERLNKNGRDYAISCTYLADGYAVAGDFEKAAQTLVPRFEGRKGDDHAMMGQFYSNLAGYALNGENAEQAREAMAMLQNVIDICESTNPGLAGNLTIALRLHRNRLAALEGEAAETQWLGEMFEDAKYVIRRMEIAKTLAMDAVNRGDKATAADYLKKIHREAGKSCYMSWASRMQNRL